MVYFIELEGTQFVRIGYTGDISDRLRNIQSNNPHTVRVIGTCDGDRRVERYYHCLFKNQHVRGDWFLRGPELEKFLESRFSD